MEELTGFMMAEPQATRAPVQADKMEFARMVGELASDFGFDWQTVQVEEGKLTVRF